MSDYFALLGLPRRPWIEPETLKDRFHALAAQHHPDAAGEAGGFAELNLAYSVLKEPAARLRHLLDLEYAAEIVTNIEIPPALADRFMEVATLERETRVFLQQQSAATSAVARSLLAAERFTMHRDVEKVLIDLEDDSSRLVQLLRTEDSLWDQRDGDAGRRLLGLQQEFAYVAKWTNQLRERLFQLDAAS